MRIDTSLKDKLTRRALLATTGGSALALAAEPARGQRFPAPARPKGPLVWLDMDQRDLDESYDQAVYAFNVDNVLERGREANVSALAKIGPPLRVNYGPREIEENVIYRTKDRGAPTLIFIHGGAWHRGRSAPAAMAEVYVKAGAHFVSVDFDGVEDTAGSLIPMVDQCRRAVAWVFRNAASFGGDPDRLYLSGHSSGAHLASCVLITEWVNQGLPAGIFKSAILGSGMYDLKSVRLSSRSNYVKFTDEMEQALSAQRHLDRIHTPVVLTYGTLETPEFQRQTRDFAAALAAAGKPVRLLVGRGYNHFETQETLANPYGFMGRAALEMMNLAV